jgi:AAA domain-containing protein
VTITFQRATKTQARLRLAIPGPAGAGKTMTSIRIGRGLIKPGERIALIDTERGSASKYADLFDFDTLALDNLHPDAYVQAIKAAEAAGYPVIIVDSLTHAWKALLEEVERRKTSERNQFTAWRQPDLAHSALIEAILQSRSHVIATMRTKMDYAIDGGEVKKLGMAPVQRAGTEYEFDVVGDMDLSHNMKITKTRIDFLADKVIAKPGEELGAQIRAWLESGAPAVELPTPKVAALVQPAPPPTRAVSPNGKPAANAERDALITECVHIWGKSIDAAKAFVAEHNLSNALSNWATEDLVAFKEHMTAAVLAKA